MTNLSPEERRVKAAEAAEARANAQRNKGLKGGKLAQELHSGKKTDASSSSPPAQKQNALVVRISITLPLHCLTNGDF